MVTKAFLLQFNAFHVIVHLNFLNPWGTCLQRAYFLREGYLFQWNVEEREPRSSCFPRRETYRCAFHDDFRFELVKMKHLHFKKVSLKFSEQIRYLVTLLQSVFCSF